MTRLGLTGERREFAAIGVGLLVWVVTVSVLSIWLRGWVALLAVLLGLFVANVVYRLVRAKPQLP